MLERLRTQIGTAGLVVAIAALVAALGGGAYAATGGNGGGKATASAKQGKQGKQGKPGKAGPAGPIGPAGPAGAPGAKGDTGAAGSNGTNGTNGAKGEPGAPGKEGKAGSAWVPENTLQEGATEVGRFGFGAVTQAPAGVHFAELTFPVSLSTAPEVIKVPPNKGSEPGCPGRGGTFPPAGEANFQPGRPEAEPGKLCIYEELVLNATIGQMWSMEYFGEFEEWGITPGANRTGGSLQVNCSEACSVYGSWAVTAAEE
jgi:hypothetical protein